MSGKERWIAEGIAGALLLFSLLLLVTNILPTRANLHRLMREEERLTRENAALREHVDRLSLKARALATDPLHQEAEFRRAYRTGRPGETVYQFEEPVGEEAASDE
jgi:hypothetical protein